MLLLTAVRCWHKMDPMQCGETCGRRFATGSAGWGRRIARRTSPCLEDLEGAGLLELMGLYLAWSETIDKSLFFQYNSYYPMLMSPKHETKQKSLLKKNLMEIERWIGLKSNRQISDVMEII